MIVFNNKEGIMPNDQLILPPDNPDFKDECAKTFRLVANALNTALEGAVNFSALSDQSGLRLASGQGPDGYNYQFSIHLRTGLVSLSRTLRRTPGATSISVPVLLESNTVQESR